MINLRKSAKHALENLAVAFGLDRISRHVHGSSHVILAYHNIVPDDLTGIGDSSLHLPVGLFRQHLDTLTSTHNIRPLDAVLRDGIWGSVTQPMAAITFDDAYRGVLELALPELRARKLPATLFVAPGILGDRTLWWDAVSDPSLGAPQPALRERILAEGQGKEAAARHMSHGARWSEMPQLLRTATETELGKLTDEDPLTIGSHSWSHPSLPHLPPDQIARELLQSREWLQQRFKHRYLDILSYPYGYHSEEVCDATAAAGYLAGLALHGTPPTGETKRSRFTTPRKNVPSGLSRNGLRLRLARGS